jgi:hypothetical protein
MLDADLSYNFYAVGNFNVIANSPRIIESKRITNDSSTKKEQGIIMIFSSTDLFFVIPATFSSQNLSGLYHPILYTPLFCPSDLSESGKSNAQLNSYVLLAEFL